MSGNSDQLHKATLSVYSNLMDQFNPGLQKLVALGNSYVKAFQALAVCSEAYFSAVAKMGEQAMHTLSSRSLGDVLLQISETQRRLTAEMEGVFRWFQIEVLQAMEKKVKLDEEYMDVRQAAGVMRLEVKEPTEKLEKQTQRGTFRDLAAPSPLPSRSRSSSVGESLGLAPGRAMRALVAHPASANPKLLSFARGEALTVLLLEPRNGWLYGRTDGSLRGSATVRSSSMNNLLDPADTHHPGADQSESKSYGDVAPPATPIRRASVDVRPVSPLPAGRSYGEQPAPPLPPPPPPPPLQGLRRGSVDVRPVSPLPEAVGGSGGPTGTLMRGWGRGYGDPDEGVGVGLRGP
ncbi:hypothetical protein CRUP_033323 [Coryphaenoides rupestris]|nr:hypothetical protein CRUP_033323 [Coryphaenoides rupestris]